ncbi:hypothetical protein COB64_00345 [Candidatus Wolfebacteria bacterium]|nr:MAG: hypothetical protein COB64_00345 [Candidatus Wolfebacteria bacterium]
MKIINREVLQSVYQIIAGAGTGTAFEISIDNEYYLVTAAHCITEKDIFIFHDKQKIKLDYLWKKKHSHADIAVIKLKEKINGSISLENNEGTNYKLSEQLFFLGFPYRLGGAGSEINNGFDLPFVKSGIFSAMDKNREKFYIDAQNNPGFSGGPVIQVDTNGNSKVIGVVHGFIPENKAFGFENTGICIAINISLAIDIIKEEIK